MVDAARAGWRARADDLTDRQRAICEFTEKLTRTPGAMTPLDLDTLRTVGLDDEQIVDVVHIIGYFNHINRVADALGVDAEDFMPEKR